MALMLIAVLSLCGAALAETVHVAVAANFTEVAEKLAPLYTAATGNQVLYSFGATGQLYAQISQSAPYDVLLAADAERPHLAVAEGFGVAGTQFTYATGALALYSATLDLTDGAAILAAGDFDHIAIADPQSAPYGRAAVETLAALDLTKTVAPKLVTGQSITQTLQFVDSGNAEIGFVAASQVAGKAGVWLVPDDLYNPICQDAVLLAPGEHSPAARDFLDFLKSEAAAEVIRAAGYRL